MSGDLLGAGLIEAIKARYPDATFEGIGGSKMIAEGCHSLFPMERLSIMGLVAVLGRLRELLKIRKTLYQTFIDNPPDVFIGIDSPDFTIPLELKLKQAGIKTVHYVSPTVWAWRQKRIFKIAKSIDLMLTLLPFEAQFYREHNVPVQFVGHPLANLIDMEVDLVAAKSRWGFGESDKVVAVLPGSRGGELKYMAPLFIDVMSRCLCSEPDLKFIIPLASPERRLQFEGQLENYPQKLPVTLVDGYSREVMACADVVLATSGTVTLEAMLLKKPMVVAYLWGKITHAIITRLAKSEFISLPNLLANKALVPEFIQEQATPENLAASVMTLLNDEAGRVELVEAFRELHLQIRKDANNVAAKSILELIE